MSGGDEHDGLCTCWSGVGLRKTSDNPHPGVRNCFCAFCCPVCQFGDIAATLESDEFCCGGQPTQAAVSYFVASPFFCATQWVLPTCMLNYCVRRAMLRVTEADKTENKCASLCVACFCPQCSNAQVYRRMKGVRPEKETMFGAAPRAMHMKRPPSVGTVKKHDHTWGADSCRYCRSGGAHAGLKL